ERRTAVARGAAAGPGEAADAATLQAAMLGGRHPG
ncbi:MAG: hypothetical protein JWM31_3284, partial [Solirubrobacterales bacterium]|nr:hypothetical protein [Solirubrobacterales bacterium]